MGTESTAPAGAAVHGETAESGWAGEAERADATPPSRLAEGASVRSIAAGGASGERDRVSPRRFSTRRRLFVAFAALAAACLAALALQLHRLERMKSLLAELHEHEEEMRLALELESAVRAQFAQQSHVVIGEEAYLAGYRDARGRAAGLLRQLSASVDEPHTIAWVDEIRLATLELDRVFEDEIAPAVRAGAPEAKRAHERTYPLVYLVEENTDRLFGFLQKKGVELSAAVDGMRAGTVRLAIAFMIVTVAFAVTVAFYLSRSIARPLARIGAGAARMAGGDLGARIELRGDDEFGALASELNDMAASLKRGREALVRAETLAGLGRMAAGIAHEINNPLQVMLGYLSLHRDRVDGELGRDLKRMEREATRCKDIVESLLELAKPPVPAPVEPVDLREVSQEVAGALGVAMNGSAPAIRVVGEGAALAAPPYVRQILLNLAKNAVEAAGAAGGVELRVGRDGSRALVTVSDTGPGVPREHRDRIFDPFFTTKRTGTGLGLPIARSMAGALGGDLEIEANDGGGARFTLRLPLANHGGEP